MTRSSSSIVCLLLGSSPNPAATMTSLPWLCSSVVHSFCSPPVALATPPIAACGRFLIMHTHSCHAACQYAINTSHLFTSHEGSRASGFLPQSFSAAPRGSRLSASLFLYIVEGNKSHGEAYRIHCASIHPSRHHEKLRGASKCKQSSEESRPCCPLFPPRKCSE